HLAIAQRAPRQTWCEVSGAQDWNFDVLPLVKRRAPFRGRAPVRTLPDAGRLSQKTLGTALELSFPSEQLFDGHPYFRHTAEHGAELVCIETLQRLLIGRSRKRYVTDLPCQRRPFGHVEGDQLTHFRALRCRFAHVDE